MIFFGVCVFLYLPPEQRAGHPMTARLASHTRAIDWILVISYAK